MRLLYAVALLALGAQPARSQGLDLPPANPTLSPRPDGLTLLLRQAPRVTRTKDGRCGDPLNVALVGTREEVAAAFRAAGWSAADPITVRSSVGIAASVALNVPYRRAPVSNLYLWGRPQDLAFEHLVGRSARSRDHIRLWCAGAGPDDRPVWLGAATFDAWVGRSSTTGKITHHIAPDIDTERDKLMGDLHGAGRLERAFLVPFLGWNQGRNGGGDCYSTDGNLAVGILARPCGCGQPWLDSR
jgi:hypothetical protein